MSDATRAGSGGRGGGGDRGHRHGRAKVAREPLTGGPRPLFYFQRISNRFSAWKNHEQF
jgi:hypothetical protein